jgi:uncharacterized membrane protein YphA (DoxX/SURF4 family)
MQEKGIHSAYWALRVAFGVVPIVAGLDKFANLLVDWRIYMSPFFERLIPMSPTTFMHLVGVVEIVVGLAVLTSFTRLGAYAAAVWLACIAVNILTSGHHLDVAVRDLVMALGAYTLARLEEVREREPARQQLKAASATT